MISPNILNQIPEKYRAAIAATDNVHIAIDAEYAIKAMDQAYLDDNNILRWMSNDRVVPRGETMNVWIVIGFATKEQAARNRDAQEREDAAWLQKNEAALSKFFAATAGKNEAEIEAYFNQ